MAGVLGLTTGAYSAAEPVPSAAMNRKLENFIMPLYGGSIPANSTRWLKWTAVRIPWACDIVGVSAWCNGVMTGGSVDIYDAGATVLTAPIDLAGDTQRVGTMVADPSIAQNAEVSLMVLAEGNINRLQVVVVIAVD
jgi:hypothetical protein